MVLVDSISRSSAALRSRPFSQSIMGGFKSSSWRNENLYSRLFSKQSIDPSSNTPERLSLSLVQTRPAMRAPLLAAAGLASLAQAAPPVRTTSGVLTGVPGKNSASTTAYLGIPFAQPPVGPLRFRAPVRLHTRDATRNASKYGQDCPGTINLGGAGPGVPGVTDDCLYLNVWAPEQGKGDKAKAVLVWFYGGGFVGGGTSQGYDASLLASSQDVVVVTTNYRLTIFGYPGSPDVAEKNPGLLDQRMAVEWVRDNIAAFGGDTKRIVLVCDSIVRFVAYHCSLDNLREPIRSICTPTLGTTKTQSCRD